MGLFNLKPGRSVRVPEIVADLDELIPAPIAFKFEGKTYECAPVDAGLFLKVSQALSKIQDMKEREVTPDEIVEGYLSFLKPVCPEITREMIKKMSVSQLTALINLILKHLTGESFNVGAEEPSQKKKKSVKKGV